MKIEVGQVEIQEQDLFGEFALAAGDFYRDLFVLCAVDRCLVGHGRILRDMGGGETEGWKFGTQSPGAARCFADRAGTTRVRIRAQCPKLRIDGHLLIAPTSASFKVRLILLSEPGGRPIWWLALGSFA
jgi:hypothetical protein